MVNKRSKFLVGLFMAGGMAIGLVALIWLGMNRYFEEGRYYASYFDQSVQGLSVDSPVKYRGVAVGRVAQIAVAPDSRLIMVIMKIESDIALEQDMIAQLKVVGITGSMFIELDRASQIELAMSPKLNFPSEYPIVASKPSDISEIFKGLDELINQISNLDLPNLSQQAQTVLHHIDQAVTDLQLATVSTKLQRTLDNINSATSPQRMTALLNRVDHSADVFDQTLLTAREGFTDAGKLLDDLRQVIAANQEALHLAITDFQNAMGRANLLIERLVTLTDRTDDNLANLHEQLSTAFYNVTEASANLNRSLEEIRANPAKLVFGAPPPPRQR